jgi:hypothetical protein
MSQKLPAPTRRRPRDHDGAPEAVNAVQRVLAFDNDNPAFTYGFEAGIIWSFCVHQGFFEGVIHAANTEMVIRIAESTQLPFTANDIGEDDAWIFVKIGNPPTVSEFEEED